MVETAKSAHLQLSGFEKLAMKISEKEQLTDELLGEAVLALLRAKGPISIKLLIGKLKDMERSEKDSVRHKTLREMIAEIATSHIAGNIKQVGIIAQEQPNNVVPLLSHPRARNLGKKR